MLSDFHQKCFKKIHNVLTVKNGKSVRLVGGAVRDLLRGQEPNDLDFATDALPMEVSKLFNKFMYRTVPTGIKHGTLTVIVDGQPFEITTLRVDAKTDGRHAVVEYTDSWEEDARRRDLTINAMSMELDGTIHDYFGGLDDLKSGKLRFVGDANQRIQEDYLRIMRYFRFASHASPLALDAYAMTAIFHHAEGLELISGERLWSELIKILSGANRVLILHHMNNMLVSRHLNLPIRYAGLQHIKDMERHNGYVPLHAIAALLNNIEELDALRARLKFDTNSYNILAFIIKNRNTDLTIDSVKEKIANGVSPDLLMQQAVYSINWDAQEVLKKMKENPLPKFPINGNDVKQAGVQAGPSIGHALDALRDHWIKSGFTATREELLGTLNT